MHHKKSAINQLFLFYILNRSSSSTLNVCYDGMIEKNFLRGDKNSIGTIGRFKKLPGIHWHAAFELCCYVCIPGQ
jgi:hypothetical protein